MITFSKSVVTAWSSVVHNLKIKTFVLFMLITIHSSHWRKKKREREHKERSLPEAPHGHSLADTISEDNLTCEKIAARVLSCNCYGALSQQPTNQNRKGTSPFLRAALSLKPGSKPWGGNVATAQQLESGFAAGSKTCHPMTMREVV